MAPADPAGPLTLVGYIVDIAPLPRTARGPQWRVALAVDRVVSGSFDGHRFEFAVHSPVKSGLAIGQYRTVQATRIGSGFHVDPLQWLPDPKV